ncbi:Hypothetical predicted protein [Paramuricea clavata]|uniref:Uncharacterized protein n=1 Tax=Paramuricea clavata TaxID=317549 RepID=A0A7D9DWK4_PARCT|nr:Hypothetical predicted protein [Paramuricea clavata]
MSSIVTGILSSTVGLLLNEARSSAAAKLRNGDVTDAEIGNIVVSELNDIKTKLDALSRTDLLYSCKLLKEGIAFLNDSLDKSNLKIKVSMSESQEDLGEASGTSASLDETLGLSRSLEDVVVNIKLDEDVKKKFKEAGENASRVFCNQGLSIEDRIFATKLGIISEILQHLESPKMTGCLLFLRDLHNLPAICKRLSVYLKGGFKSRFFNAAKRRENVKSIMRINYVLFQHASKFSRKNSFVLDWPTIELNDRRFNPILHWHKVSKKRFMWDEMRQHPNGLVLDERIIPEYSAVNKDEDIVAVLMNHTNVEAFSRKGERKVVKLPDIIEKNLSNKIIKGLAVDNNNNIYMVTRLQKRTENGLALSYVLYVLDKEYNIKHERRITDIFETIQDDPVRIAMNKDNDIIMIKAHDPYVYICDSDGELKVKFEPKSGFSISSFGISENNEIMMSSSKEVLIYSEKGVLISRIEVPEGHEVCGVAFHSFFCKIIVLTYVDVKSSVFLLCYTAMGERLESTTFFCKKNSRKSLEIKSHPSGRVAIIRKRSIIFI